MTISVTQAHTYCLIRQFERSQIAGRQDGSQLRLAKQCGFTLALLSASATLQNLVSSPEDPVVNKGQTLTMCFTQKQVR